ncbi:hypothetical protein CP533_3650 [Ophiocordyceps camponoti-saundersi (nom. inval.)]|nr:hypothetical protein CP533_3650 [Ophiocordyceps camponoti-saundersi (nom. inval.)]
MSDLFGGDESESDDVFVSPVRRPIRVEIPASTLGTPRAYYEPFDDMQAPIMTEAKALAALARVQRGADDDDDDDYISYDLDDYAVYQDREYYPCEMRSLHQLERAGQHYFCGILSIKGQNPIFVKHVPIAFMPVGNYGDLSEHTVRDEIWLQSELNRRSNVYYKLGKPAKEYVRFYKPSLWVLDLAKHFVDFLKVMQENRRPVSLNLFRRTFRDWLTEAHGDAPAFIEWAKQFPRTDFRTAVVANISYLHKEAIGVLGERETYSHHPIWSEIWTFSRYKPQPAATDRRTVVTQYIFDCFAETLFKEQLTVVPMSASTEKLRKKLIRERHLELALPSALDTSLITPPLSTTADEHIKNIKPGDTISTHRDDELSGTKWKREISRGFQDADRWFALVQKVHIRKRVRVFDVIWYYRPVDTLCGLMKYPWENELFLSDHCSCESETCKIREDEVLGVHDVDFGGTPTTTAEFFCRQTYMPEERKWISLGREHMRCEHVRQGGASREPLYQAGDTLLVLLKPRDSIAEPCELVTVIQETETQILYQLRQLVRRRRADPQARPNELVYTNSLFECKEERIIGRCHVRVFPAGSNIPTPYDRDGVGCFFYMTHRQDGDTLEPLASAPTTLRQGFDPEAEIPRLRGFDLFCGGGNFGRGLEEGGAIKMKWANDYDKLAVHSYMANVPSGTVTPFFGSIDDLQRSAMLGKFSDAVPAIGEVDFVSGGSPCPGFSRLTNDKTTAAQRKNQSLVASFGSFIDLYRPKYGLLENVPGIVHKKESSRAQDIFSQLICAIVGLGYQAEFFFLDASSCGSPQRRSRVFLAFAAPGCRLPAKPTITHAHPPNTRAQSLGMLPTGESMAEREMPRATPFDYISAAEATADLPAIDDSRPDTCVLFPDHRVAVGMTYTQRLRVSLIPKHPWGMNLAEAWFGPKKGRGGGGGGGGVLTKAEQACFNTVRIEGIKAKPGQQKSRTNAYGRQWPNRLMETIVTTANPCDSKNGRTIHWSEDRPTSIMEARRAQGFRDDEVVLGAASTQFKIVGNSVAREVAVALGAVFREAWAETLRTSQQGLGAAAATAVTDNSSSTSVSASLSPSREASRAPWGGASTAPTTPTPGLSTGKRQSFLVVELPDSKRRRVPSSKGQERITYVDLDVSLDIDV